MLLKRTVSLLLATVLVLGSALPVLAEETDYDLSDSEVIVNEAQEDSQEEVSEDSSEEDQSLTEEDSSEESSEITEEESAPNEEESTEISEEDSEEISEDSVEEETEESTEEDSSETTEEESLEAEALEATYAGLSTPRIVTDSSMDAGQKVTWDCIYFGSYPQAEVVASPNYEAIEGEYLQKGDIIVDSSLYSQLQNASWSNNTTTIGGNKYQRMQESDATCSTTGESSFYDWSKNTATYRYFKYEPIKWRVLAIDGSTALVLADKALDDQVYNTEYTSVTWETSTIRTWLNGTFKNRAFSSSEQGAIVSTTVINKNNTVNGTAGGNNTTDKVFLLAESDVYTNENASTSYGGNAQAYGFASVYFTFDEARRCKSSTYAKAMGTYWWDTDTDYAGNCYWWLRSPGRLTNHAADVGSVGIVYRNGISVRNYTTSVRPALKINLSSSNLWSNAGTVCSETHDYESNTTAATTTKDGKVTKTCKECGKVVTSTIKYAKYVKLKAATYTYTGKAIKPSVIIKDSAGNSISSKYYTITYPTKCSNPGSYKVSVKFKGNYTGTKTLTYKINPKGTSIASITASSKGFTVKWKKQSTQTTGYQIRYSTSSKMTSAKTVTVSKNTTVSKKITKLLPRKRYYVQVRTYKKIGTKKYYSTWSTKKYVTTKS